MPDSRGGTRTLTFVLLLVLGLVGSVRAAVIVKEIVVQGNRAIEAATIRFKIQSKEGAELSPVQIRRDIRAIYATGFFEDVVVETEPVVGGVRLIYRVKEKPIVVGYEVRGNKKVTLSTIQEKIELKFPSAYDPVAINKAVQAIRAEYVERGFNDVSIAPVTQDLGGNQMRLTFVINEGQKIRIASIDFVGNETFRDGNRFWGLKSKLKKTKERWFLSWLTTGGKYRPEQFQEDLDKVEEFYKSKGFARVALGKPKLEFEDRVKGWLRKKSRRYVRITIPVNEGQRYRFGKLDVEGMKVFDRDTLLSIIHGTKLETKVGESVFLEGEKKLSTGEYYNIKLVEEVEKTFVDLYGSRGYIYVSVNPETVLDDERLVADVTWRIREGLEARLHRLEFKGNAKTRDKVLRRAMGMSENDVFDSLRFRNGMSRLNYLGYITDVVPEVDSGPSPTDLDVTVNVNDSRQTEIQLSGGYSSVDKFVGTLSLTEKNLFGRGQEMNLSASTGKYRTSFQLSFSDEYLFDTRNYGSFGLWNTTRQFPVYRRRVVGGSIAVGRPLFGRISGRLGYKYEVNNLFDVDEEKQEDLAEDIGKSRTSSVTQYLLRDTRDNRLEPKRGNYTRFSFEVAGGALGGDNYFYKTEVEHTWYVPLGKLV